MHQHHRTSFKLSVISRLRSAGIPTTSPAMIQHLRQPCSICFVLIFLLKSVDFGSDVQSLTELREELTRMGQ